jgi:MoaA/NifB/PqqE/SkfB family radical SAM enzyme
MKRFDLKISFDCNNRCRHCVQGDKRTLGRPKSPAVLKKELRAALKDCQTLVFTGGEPTLDDGLVAMIRTASEMGYRHIQIQTNARRLAYEAFARACIDAGADEFAIALHGHESRLHDYVTRVPGSFDQTIQGIRNIRKMGADVITNTVPAARLARRQTIPVCLCAHPRFCQGALALCRAPHELDHALRQSRP